MLKPIPASCCWRPSGMCAAERADNKRGRLSRAIVGARPARHSAMRVWRSRGRTMVRVSMGRLGAAGPLATVVFLTTAFAVRNVT